MDAVMYTLEQLEKRGEHYEYLVLLQPTSPLRTGKDIETCIQKAIACGQDVVAISEVSDSPVLMRTCGENGELSSLLEGTSTVRRQDMPAFYRVNGSVYVNKTERLSSATSLNDNPVGCILSKEHSVDIDEPVDFATAEFYLKGQTQT
jgi:CMP-N-acetylneuraminic acid synthetase